jgi:hypothetical protein
VNHWDSVIWVWVTWDSAAVSLRMNRVNPVSQHFFQLSDDRHSKVFVPDVIEETLSETEEVWKEKVEKVDIEVHGVAVDAFDVGEVDRPDEGRGRDHADKHAHIGGLDNVMKLFMSAIYECLY